MAAMLRWHRVLLLLASAALPAVCSEPEAALVRRDAEGGECAKQIGFIHIGKCGGTEILVSLTRCCIRQMLWTQRGVQKISGGMYRGYFHASALEQRLAVGPSIWNQAYKFALVRNPWARHVSMFFFLAGSTKCGDPQYLRRWRSLCQDHWQLDTTLDSTKLGPADFRAWVMRQYTAYPPGSQSVHRVTTRRSEEVLAKFGSLRSPTQWAWITDENSKVIVDEWFKLEELQQSWGRLQSRLCALKSISYAEHSGRGTCPGTGDQSGQCKGAVAGAPGSKPKRRYQDQYDNHTRAILSAYMHQDILHFRYTFD